MRTRDGRGVCCSPSPRGCWRDEPGATTADNLATTTASPSGEGLGDKVSARGAGSVRELGGERQGPGRLIHDTSRSLAVGVSRWRAAQVGLQRPTFTPRRVAPLPALPSEDLVSGSDLRACANPLRPRCWVLRHLGPSGSLHGSKVASERLGGEREVGGSEVRGAGARVARLGRASAAVVARCGSCGALVAGCVQGGQCWPWGD